MRSANVHQVMGALANFGFHGLKAEDLGRLYGADPHEEELIVMAETAAYFHVAYKVPIIFLARSEMVADTFVAEDYRQHPSYN